jgi:uncharacterized protein (TIGR02186 family)
MRRIAAFIVYFLMTLPLSAQEDTDKRLPETLNIGVSSREIAIAPDFAGTDVTVFGALDGADPYLLAIGAYDIVVSLSGPKAFTTIRKKERVAGIWINRHSVTFEPIPESYSVASTRVVDQIGSPDDLSDHGVGMPRVKLVSSSFSGRAEEVTEFRDAFLRLKQKDKLYQENPGGVSFVSSSLFQATIHIPADIPNGEHTIHAVLFKSGDFIAEKDLPLHVEKTGLEESITHAAANNAFLYGLFSVMMAVVTGWGASLVFRRD